MRPRHKNFSEGNGRLRWTPSGMAMELWATDGKSMTKSPKITGDKKSLGCLGLQVDSWMDRCTAENDYFCSPPNANNSLWMAKQNRFRNENGDSHQTSLVAQAVSWATLLVGAADALILQLVLQEDGCKILSVFGLCKDHKPKTTENVHFSLRINRMDQSTSSRDRYYYFALNDKTDATQENCWVPTHQKNLRKYRAKSVKCSNGKAN